MAEVNGSLLYRINCFIFSVMTGMAVYWYVFKTEKREQTTVNDQNESRREQRQSSDSNTTKDLENSMNNKRDLCDLCIVVSKERAAEVFCKECEQFQCMNCKKQHQNLPPSMSHSSMSVEDGILIKKKRKSMICDPCKFVDQVSTAQKLCNECRNILLCWECAKKHTVNKATRFHTLSEDFTSRISDEIMILESSSSENDTNTNGNAQTKQQKENEQDLICKYVKLETEFYTRFVLLLMKCGTNILRQVFIRGIESQNTTLTVFLSSQRVKIYRRTSIDQRNILYPSSPNETSIDQWDISLLSLLLTIEYFENVMTTPETIAVKKIRKWRNDFIAHHANACIDEKNFLKLWNELTLIIHTIGHKLKEADRTENENWMNTLCSVKLDMNTAIEEIKKLDQTDELTKSIQISLNDFLGEKSTIVQDLTAIKKELALLKKGLLDKQSTNENPGKLETDAHILYGGVHVRGDVVDQAETALLAACKKDKCRSQEEQMLTETIVRFKEEIGKANAEVQDVDQGSIIFTIKCNTIEGVLDLIKVFESKQLQKRVSDIADALTEVTGEGVQLVAYLLRQPLLEVLRTMQSKDSDEKFIGIPTGLEGFHHVVKTFMEDGLSYQELSKALSHCVGTRVAEETPIDVHQLQHDIHVAKEQLALPGCSQRVSTEEMVSENLPTTELFDKTSTEEIKDEDVFVTKRVILKEPSASSEGLQPDEDYGAAKPGRTYSVTNEENDQLQDIDRRLDKNCPGQPEATAISADTVTLIWEPPSNFGRNDYYVISYSTDKSSNYNWKVYPIETKYETAILTGLKTKTKYVFRVRAEYIDGEGPYSPNSLEITTTESLASQVLPKATKIQNDEYSPTTYRLPVADIESARDETNKTKKYEIGIAHKGYVKSKTILLVGATGTGKTTLVDGITNYALGVSWKDSFRFTTVHSEESEQARLKNQALSQTDWITCYTINHEKGSRLKYQLHVLDTPGFGDTQGPKRDKEIATQLKELFSQEEPKGVTYIDALCFLVKSPDARLTVSQKYVFDSVLSLFGKDVENNICYLITFADNNEPPVLAAMKESKLPSGRYFKFNNSGLFARNENAENVAGKMFWDMGLDSFNDFFKHLDVSVETLSLKQTQDVLDERHLLEKAVSNLQPQIDLGMSKVAELKNEKLILKEHFTLNKGALDFEYEIEAIKPQKRIFDIGKPIAECQNCYQICNKTAIFTDGETGEKRCRVCPNQCSWKYHTSVQSICEYIPVKMKKQYFNMKQKVEKVRGHRPSQQQIVEHLEEELKQISERVEYLMFVVKSCTDRLTDIALRRPNPLSIVEYIDMMIYNEKKEQRVGFQNRVLGLEEIRKRTNITGEYEKFSKDASDVLKESGEAKTIWLRSVFEKANNLVAKVTT